MGRRVLVTRSREQASELVDLLEAQGAEAVEGVALGLRLQQYAYELRQKNYLQSLERETDEGGFPVFAVSEGTGPITLATVRKALDEARRNMEVVRQIGSPECLAPAFGAL